MRSVERIDRKRAAHVLVLVWYRRMRVLSTWCFNISGTFHTHARRRVLGAFVLVYQRFSKCGCDLVFTVSIPGLDFDGCGNGL